MEASNGQLQTKYQKIATEYSKIRAQANVLKKAVIDEQSRNGDLHEQLKEKEMGLRRAEQELDSLTFRNQQLTKRVTVLQEELDNIQNRGKKNRSKSTESKTQSFPLPNHILDEEFQKKIVENAQLVSQISDKESEIAALNQRLDSVEHKLNQCIRSKLELENKHRTTVEKLESEKSDLQKRLNEKQYIRTEKQDEMTNGQSRQTLSVDDGETEDSESRHEVLHRANVSSSSSPSSQRLPRSPSDYRPTEVSASHEETSDEFDIERFIDLEKELNHWKAEYNIIKIKFDDLRKKDDTRKGQLENNIAEPLDINNMVGRLNAPFAIPEEIEAREAKIKGYFVNQIDRLVAEKHVCHIRNVAIAADTEIMNIHLVMSESKREKCEAALQEAQKNLESLQEAQEEQDGNYKAQLTTMSEHLANMNDKLIRQTEEIQQLKFELANKNGKKGKQK